VRSAKSSPQSGQASADLRSARPGYSEHQTGLAIDISALPENCTLDETCFADTAGQWLATNAFKWGVVLRYPSDKTPVTGYEFEPWHYRYVGVALATEMHNTGITTLEEFFGLPAAPTYAGSDTPLGPCAHRHAPPRTRLAARAAGSRDVPTAATGAPVVGHTLTT
jgi:hypothetical protein